MVDYGVAACGYLAGCAYMCLDMDPTGGASLPWDLASATSGYPHFANCDPGLCSGLLLLGRERNRLGLAVGGPGDVARLWGA
jgi:hypothetical protein